MALLPFSLQPIMDRGYPILDARLRVFRAGSTRPAVVYADPEYKVALPNPVEVNGYGTFPPMYGAGAFRLIGEDASGRAYFELDRIVLVDPDPPAEAGAETDDGTRFRTGDFKHRYGIGSHAGWVRAAGRTIGSDNSGGSERANADCRALFSHLWDADPNLAVAGGRGATAEADWIADKTITLPDARGRVLTGLDAMGAEPAQRLGFGLFGFGNPLALGSYGGEAVHRMVGAELASHIHGAVATMDTQGVHTHPVDLSTIPSHNHEVRYDTVSRVVTSNNDGSQTVVTALGATGAISSGTGQGGSFQPTATIGTGGGHFHNAVVTIDAAGSGQPFNVLSPFLLVSIYIKL